MLHTYWWFKPLCASVKRQQQAAASFSQTRILQQNSLCGLKETWFSNQYSSLLKMQDSAFNVNHKVNIWWMGQIYLDTGISPAVLACQGRSKASKPKGKIALTLDWWIKDNYSFTEEWLMQMFSANQESTITPVCLQSTQSVILYEFYCPFTALLLFV